MKKALRIIVPILLGLLIIASLVWYLFVYDRGFTRDMLLHQARYHSTSGNPKIGSWFYDLAYEYSGQDENVAIELANQYKAEGNYTKAEYTLTHSIADGGTLDLYIALCKTYVEQDKLLDAVQMLDRVSNSEIKAQLDALRPKAPVADYEPGFYSQYISVSLSADGGTLYASTDGQYPSTHDDPYSQPLELPGGETTIYSLCVADNGLVSPLSVYDYTIAGVIEPVTFVDLSIELALKEILNADVDQIIYTSDLWSITEFTVPADAESFDDLENLTYLESLTIHDASFDSLRFLPALTHLTSLDLSGCRFGAEELSVIGGLPALKTLKLANCSLSTISGLELAQNLEYLDLSNNTIRNLEPLSSLLQLQEINLTHNALTGLTALGTLSKLEKLDVSYNALESIAPIATCLNLRWLDVSENDLSNLGAIDNLTKLTYLAANHNSLTELEHVAALTALTELYVSRNLITDIGALSTLTALEIFDFSYNEVEKLPNWPDGSKLRSINGSYNKIKSIASLKNMMELTYVYMDYNEITSVAELASCYKLVMVNVYGSKVKGVEKLTEQGVIVNYDPT